LSVYLALGPAPLTALEGMLVSGMDRKMLIECLLVPHLAEHALGWALVLNACATVGVGNVVGAALLCEDVVEETTG
jgi:hypothetical protein